MFNNSSNNNSGYVAAAPAQQYTLPTVVHETVIPTNTQEIQPIVHRQIEQTEIRQITQPIYEKAVLPTQYQNSQGVQIPQQQFGQSPYSALSGSSQQPFAQQQQPFAQQQPLAQQPQQQFTQQQQPFAQQQPLAQQQFTQQPQQQFTQQQQQPFAQQQFTQQPQQQFTQQQPLAQQQFTQQPFVQQQQPLTQTIVRPAIIQEIPVILPAAQQGFYQQPLQQSCTCPAPHQTTRKGRRQGRNARGSGLASSELGSGANSNNTDPQILGASDVTHHSYRWAHRDRNLATNATYGGAPPRGVVVGKNNNNLGTAGAHCASCPLNQSNQLGSAPITQTIVTPASSGMPGQTIVTEQFVQPLAQPGLGSGLGSAGSSGLATDQKRHHPIGSLFGRKHHDAGGHVGMLGSGPGLPTQNTVGSAANGSGLSGSNGFNNNLSGPTTISSTTTTTSSPALAGYPPTYY